MIDLTCILYLMEDVIGSFTTGYVVMYACIHLHNCINRLTETLLGRCRNFGTYHARRQYYLNLSSYCSRIQKKQGNRIDFSSSLCRADSSEGHTLLWISNIKYWTSLIALQNVRRKREKIPT